MKDFDKIKEAQARRDDRFKNWDSQAAGNGHAEANDRALLLAATPDLIAELERITADRGRLRAGIEAAREHIDADRIATAYAALGAL